jgi:hypothetical protein
MIKEKDQTELAYKKIAQFDYEELRNDVNERLKYQFEFSQAIFKSLFLINGGAIVALLTFIGNGKSIVDKTNLFLAMLFFCLGLAFILIAHFGAYFSQGYFMYASSYQAHNAKRILYGLEIEAQDLIKKNNKKGMIAFIAAIVFAGLSLLFFSGGTIFALDGVL